MEPFFLDILEAAVHFVDEYKCVNPLKKVMFSHGDADMDWRQSHIEFELKIHVRTAFLKILEYGVAFREHLHLSGKVGSEC